MTTITIITGSVRPGRFNIQPATWIQKIAEQRSDINLKFIDLETVALPFYNEPHSPLYVQEYQHEHTKRWSEIVNTSDGFIMITPEYNRSYSPVLKNAIDYLYHEWKEKPVAFVGYGSAGGSRAVEHLRGVAGELEMYDIKNQIMLFSPWNNLDVEGKYQFNEHEESSANALLDNLIFWAIKMKQARQEKSSNK
jgi:NAD(P)H-dependent FMN reductase